MVDFVGENTNKDVKACAGCGSFHYKISENQQRKNLILIHLHLFMKHV